MSNSDLSNASEKISNMVDRLNLPRTIVDRANRLLESMYQRQDFKSQFSDTMASACVYIICRQEGIIRPFKEFCAASKISTKEVERCYKLILEAMETSLNPITNSDFNPTFCIALRLPAMIQRCSLYIGRKAVELGIVPGCSAISVAAASIYMASNASDKKLTKREIGDVTGVNDVIIRQSYELMYPRATELFPVDFELDINKLPKS